MAIDLTQWRGAESLLDATGAVHRGWRSVLASVLCLALGPSVILLMCFGVFVPVLHREFGWSISSISLGATIISLTIMLLSPLQGYLVDRLGSRFVMLVSIPMFGVGVGLLYFLPGDIRVFYAACMLLPILSIGVWPLSFMRMISTWFDQRLGLALGVTNVGAGLGAAVLPLVLGYVFQQHGWRAAYALLAALILFVIWPLAARFIRENPAVAGSSTARTTLAPAIGLSLPEVVRERPFWALCCSFFFLGILSSGMLTHQVNILMDHGLTHQQAIYLQSLLGISSIFGRLVAGWLLDRVRISRLMPALLIAAGAACVIYTATVPVALLTVSAFIFGVVIGAEFDVLGYAIRRYQGLRIFGTVYGLVFATFQLGGAIGVTTLGVIRSAAGSYSPALIAFAVVCLLAALVFASFGPYRFAPPGHRNS